MTTTLDTPTVTYTTAELLHHAASRLHHLPAAPIFAVTVAAHFTHINVQFFTDHRSAAAAIDDLAEHLGIARGTVDFGEEGRFHTAEGSVDGVSWRLTTYERNAPVTS